jgi:uncharacterized Zn-binding protein involved in type VI secretion
MGHDTVRIGFMPAATVGSQLFCVGGPDAIKSGEPSVLICGQDAARLGDPTDHEGIVTLGCPTVLVGSNPQGLALTTDKPFGGKCDKNPGT